MRVPDPRPHKRYGREARKKHLPPYTNASGIVLSLSVPTPISPKILLCHAVASPGYAGRFFAETSPDNPTRGIGCRADHPSARQPPLWRGLIFMGKSLQTVRRLLPDDVAPLVCPGVPSNVYPRMGLDPSRIETGFLSGPFRASGSGCPKVTCQRLPPPRDIGNFHIILPGIPLDHGGDVLDARRPRRNSLDLVTGLVTMHDSALTANVLTRGGLSPCSSAALPSLIRVRRRRSSVHTSWETLISLARPLLSGFKPI